MKNKDLVVAIYRRETYMGETILRLEKVWCADEDIPEEFNSYEYEIKLMQLEEFSIGD